eukprot:1229536-Pyramimonas_sp.AAC.1
MDRMWNKVAHLALSTNFVPRRMFVALHTRTAQQHAMHLNGRQKFLSSDKPCRSSAWRRSVSYTHLTLPTILLV